MVTASGASDRKLTLDQMKWVWIAAFVVVALFGFGMTQWEVIEHLIENEGVGEEGASMLAFAAGYTFPLAAGSGIVAFLALRNVFDQMYWASACLLVAGILLAAGALASELGLGLLPAYDSIAPNVSHPALRLLAWTVGGYFNTYGWPLMVSAVAIGAATALHSDAYLRDRASSTPS